MASYPTRDLAADAKVPPLAVLGGWTDGDQLRSRSSCDPIVKEYAYQSSDAVGRDDIRRALYEAETLLAQHLGYDIAPKYQQATKTWPQLADANLVRGSNFDAVGRWVGIELPRGYVVGIGVETYEVIEEAVPVTYSDPDEDGYQELATIGPVDSDIALSELGIYVSEDDRLGIDTTTSQRWRIQPCNVISTEDGLLIKASSWLFAKPKYYESVEAPDLTAQDVTKYLSVVDVVRRYVNINGTTVDDSQATLVWNTGPCHGWWCNCTSCGGNDPATSSRAVARVEVRDARRGVVAPAQALYDTENGTWNVVGTTGWGCRDPDLVTVRYLAGYPLKNGQVDPKWYRAVCALASALLSNGIAACKDANRQVFYWQQDMAKVGNDKELYTQPAMALNNPFGTRRGHIEAWNYINLGGEKQHRAVVGF